MIHFSRKRNQITKTYTIHGEGLESVDNSTQLHSSMGPHCNSTSRKSVCTSTRAFLQTESHLHHEADQVRMLQNPTASNPRVRLYSLGSTLKIRRRQARAHPAQICSLCLQRLLPGQQRHCDVSHPWLGHPGRKERKILLDIPLEDYLHV